MSSLIGEQEQWVLPGIVGNVIFMTQQTLFWSQHRFRVLVRKKLPHMRLDGYCEESRQSQNSFGLAKPTGRESLFATHDFRQVCLVSRLSIHTVAIVRTTHCVLHSTNNRITFLLQVGSHV